MMISYRDCEKAFTRFTYNESNNVFSIEDVDQESIEYHPVLALDDEYNPEDYGWEKYYNYSGSHAENSIYQVFVGEQRIGWIFPIQALLSSEHDYSDEPHFLKYAYIATWFLLESIEREFDYIPDTFHLDDVYNDDAECILVYDKGNCRKIDHFKIKDYSVSLFKYGYSKIASDAERCIDLKNLDRERKRLRIKPIAIELREETYIKQLFEKQLPIEKNEIVRFHFVYQIIEILISVVFDHHFKGIVSAMGTPGANLFELKELITLETGEKYRIEQLFSEFVDGFEAQYKTDLNQACIAFLEQNNIPHKTEYIKNLYDVRCFLVHRLYSLDPRTLELLSIVNQAFLALVIEVLCAFRKPTIGKESDNDL